MVTPEDLAKAAIEKKEAENPENFPKQEPLLRTTIIETETVIQHPVIKEPVEMSMSDRHEEMVSKVRQRGNDEGGMGRILAQGESELHGANDEYWKNIPMEILPTKGLFYPEETEITIRSADVGEIRHWSTIDDNDFLDMDTKMNFIIEKCVRMRGPVGSLLTWKDIKEIDRFFIIFRVHELTFPNGENKLLVNFGCNQQCKGDGSYRDKVHLTSNMLALFSIPEELMKYYDSRERCFVKHSTKLGETLRFYLPSIGISQQIKNMVKDARNNNGYIDPAFTKVAPYLINDYRGLSDKKLEEIRMGTFGWNKNKLLFIVAFTDCLESSVNITVKKDCPSCGTILEAPLFFRDGFTIKNLFTISTAFDDLI